MSKIQQTQSNEVDSSIIVDTTTNVMILFCPHCSDMVVIDINQLNCGIFRHGLIKSTNEQIPSHAEKSICDELFQNGLIYGCGKPFQIQKDKDDPTNISKMKVVICDYI
jgi:hypothetical protein